MSREIADVESRYGDTVADVLGPGAVPAGGVEPREARVDLRSLSRRDLAPRTQRDPLFRQIEVEGIDMHGLEPALACGPSGHSSVIAGRRF